MWKHNLQIWVVVYDTFYGFQDPPGHAMVVLHDVALENIKAELREMQLKQWSEIDLLSVVLLTNITIFGVFCGLLIEKLNNQKQNVSNTFLQF